MKVHFMSVFFPKDGIMVGCGFQVALLIDDDEQRMIYKESVCVWYWGEFIFFTLKKNVWCIHHVQCSGVCEFIRNDGVAGVFPSGFMVRGRR